MSDDLNSNLEAIEPDDFKGAVMLKRVLIGFVIGIANVIPGVSGGTIAVVFGVYNRIIRSINAIMMCPVRGVKGMIFLGPLVIGAFLGIFGSSFIMTPLLSHFKASTYAVFIGLILGTIPMIFTRHDDMSPRVSRVLVMILAAVAVGGLCLVQTPEPNLETGFHISFSSAFYLGMSGFIAAATMILPGVSGSLILLILGTYHRILFAVQQLDVVMLLIILVGALLGLVSATRLIAWLFQRFPAETYYGIAGLLIGSVVKLVPNVVPIQNGVGVWVCLLAGALVSFGVSRIQK